MVTVEYTWNPLLDSIIEETNGTGEMTTSYTSKPKGFGPLVSQSRTEFTNYFHCDALGSIRLTSDPSGAVTSSRLWDAWGQQVASQGTVLASFGWIGRWGYEFDGLVSSYQARRRTYVPFTSRWTSCDPDLPGTSFIYATIRPTLVIDPNGHATGLLLSPDSETNMKWCSATTKDKDAPDTQRDTKNGQLNKGNPGDSTPQKFDVKCVCDCCKDEKLQDGTTHKRKISCTVRLWTQILISPWEAEKIKAETDSPGGLRGVYGHEQMHVKNFIAAAKDIKDKIDKHLGNRQDRCLDPKACRKLVTECENLAATIIDATRKQEGEHKPNPPSPRRGRPYTPTNAPGDSDCTKPGPVPEFPKEKECEC